MSKHAKELWARHPLDPTIIVVAGRGAMMPQRQVAVVCDRASDPDDDPTPEEVEARAALIESAPVMLAALEALPLDREFTDAADFKDASRQFLRAMELARAAIAKATNQ